MHAFDRWTDGQTDGHLSQSALAFHAGRKRMNGERFKFKF